MKQLKHLLPFILAGFAFAQTTYELEPGSKNNLFELNVANNTGNINQSIKITVQEKPEWINFTTDEINLGKINKAEKLTAQFYFAVLGTASVGEEQNVRFRITDQNGRSWLKSYSIVVTPPTVFEVQQNYPNPFNPATTVKYSIPQDAFVSIKVFNVLGESVAELVGKEVKTGIHEVVFDATNFSSGFYFYVVEAKGVDGTKYFDSKKMILLK